MERKQQPDHIAEKSAHEAEKDQFQQVMRVLHTLSAANRKQVLEELEGSVACTCDPEKLPRDERHPCEEAAIRIYNTALRIAEEKEEQQRKKLQSLRRVIKRMILRVVHGRIGRKRKNRINKEAQLLANEMAEELVHIKDIKIQDIVNLFDTYDKRIKQECDVSLDVVENNSEDFERLIEILEARRPVKGYLRKLIIDASDLRELDLLRIWREKAAANGKDSLEAQEARASIEELAQTANKYCAAFFKPYALHPEVEEMNDIRELAQVVETALPVSVQEYRKMVSAVAKINMMHLVDTIRTQVNFAQMKAVSQHLEKLINNRKRVLPDMQEILTCGDIAHPKRRDTVLVESVRVAAEKKEEAAARKYMDKGAENTKDFDVTNIKDWIRFRVMLTKKDSQDPERTKKAIIKTMSVLCALLGTDIPEERLRFALRTGTTNQNSTGKHEAFHLTIRYRYQCGKRVKTIPVEIQIQKYMDSREAAADHDEYVQKKDRKNTRIAGMDVTFHQFITDLCDLILSDFDPETMAEFDPESRFRPMKERMVILLFLILTRKKSDGTLENGRDIREIYADERQRQKVEQIVELYREYVSFVRQKNAERNKPANPTLINKLAHEVEQIFYDLEVQHSIRTI